MAGGALPPAMPTFFELWTAIAIAGTASRWESSFEIRADTGVRWFRVRKRNWLGVRDDFRNWLLTAA